MSEYSSADSIAWGADAGTLYISRLSDQPVEWEIDNASVDPSGVTLASSVNLTGSPDTSGSIVYAAGKLYESTCFVRDATSLGIVAQVSAPPSSLSPNPYGISCLQILSGSFSAPGSAATSNVEVTRRTTGRPLHSFFIAAPRIPP